jgi:hypothetical protein
MEEPLAILFDIDGTLESESSTPQEENRRETRPVGEFSFDVPSSTRV